MRYAVVTVVVQKLSVFGMSADEGLKPPLPDGGSRHSILSGKSGRESRMDSFGNVIEKGKKSHRCSFPDDQNPPQAVEVTHEIVSYKGICLTSYQNGNDQ